MSENPKPGRELDYLVAERVMGCTTLFVGTDGVTKYCDCARKSSFDDGIHENQTGGVKRYSTDIAAAWKAVEKLASEGWSPYVGIHSCQFTRGRREDWGPKPEMIAAASGESAPHAICLAALKAVGG